MTLREIKRANDAAGHLQNKLERIAALWAELPNEDDLATMVNHAERLASALAESKETYLDEDFPSAELLEPTVESATAIARNLREAADAEVSAA